MKGSNLWTNLRSQALISSVRKQVLDNIVVIFLGGHVKRGKTILALDINWRTMLDEEFNDFFLSS